MTTREVYLPTRPSKAKCFLLIGLILIIYIIENSSIGAFIDNRILNYTIKPIYWFGLAYIVWLFPKARPKGLLKLKSFLNWWAFNFAVIYIITSILAGLINGFGKSPYSHSLIGITTNIIYLGSLLVGRELVRSYLVNNLIKQENYLIFILIALFMTGINIPLNKIMDIKEYIGLVEFMAESFAPEFCENLLVTYLVFLGGPLPSIIYLGIIQGFHWFSPILPNLKWITKALVGVLCPIFCFMSIQNTYMFASKQLKRKDRSEEGILSWIITSIVSIAIIWFSVGVFPVYPSVVATGSMNPMIKPGDMILVKKIEGDKVNTGDVIQYRKSTILISHRVIEVNRDDNGKSYRTMGDNNSGPDLDLVKPEQVKGKIIYVVPKIGWPTLLIKNKEEIPLDDIEF